MEMKAMQEKIDKLEKELAALKPVEKEVVPPVRPASSKPVILKSPPPKKPIEVSSSDSSDEEIPPHRKPPPVVSKPINQNKVPIKPVLKPSSVKPVAPFVVRK